MDTESSDWNVIHMNIRSYNRNIDDFCCFINDSLKCIDIIILSETWNSTGFSPQNLSGFSSYKSENNFRKL